MKFNLKRTLACSLAFGWISLFWGSYDSIMQLFDYDVFGLSSTWHGVIIAADNILGLFLLPLFGRLSDKSHSRFGKRKPFVVIGTIVSMLGWFGVCVFASLGKDYFVPFIISLLITLAAMAAYRSPALALVPDINTDKFRSIANAVSNVVSVILTVVAMLYFYIFMQFDGYYAIGAAFTITTLIMLLGFCLTVKEPKFVEDMERAKLAEEQAEKERLSHEAAEAPIVEADPENTVLCADAAAVSAEEIASGNTETSTAPAEDAAQEEEFLHLPEKEHPSVFDLIKYRRAQWLASRATGERKPSFRDNRYFNRVCILLIVFCFYMTYNALTSNFIKYAEYILNFQQNQAIVPLILAQVAAMVAFPLASILSNKIGRKNTILIGFVIMIAAFSASIAFSTPHPALYFIFMVLGVSFGLVMVNIYPFFLETSKETALGTDTGLFAMSMTVAMVITPILSGALIDVGGAWFGGGENAGFRVLFPYSIFFLVLALLFTVIIKGKMPVKRQKASTGGKDVLVSESESGQSSEDGAEERFDVSSVAAENDVSEAVTTNEFFSEGAEEKVNEASREQAIKKDGPTEAAETDDAN